MVRSSHVTNNATYNVQGLSRAISISTRIVLKDMDEYENSKNVFHDALVIRDVY